MILNFILYKVAFQNRYDGDIKGIIRKWNLQDAPLWTPQTAQAAGCTAPPLF